MKPDKQSNHLETIDILRGLAALAVVLFHVRVDLWVGWNELHSAGAHFSPWDRLLSWLSVPMVFGGSGVMLFFLISGFCVHLPFAGRQERLDLKAYLTRRFFRIYPPYLAAVALTVVAEWVAHDLIIRNPQSGTDLITRTALMIQNFGENAGQLSGNPSLWSLPVEMELYLAYVLLQFISLKFGWNRIFLSVVVAAIASFVTAVPLLSPGSLHFLNFWPIWCGGCLLAEWVARGKIPCPPKFTNVVALACLLAGMYAKLAHWPDSVEHYLFAVFYFQLLWWAVKAPEITQRIPSALKSRLLQLGMISYSLYLIHFPLFRLFGAVWEQAFQSKPSNFLVPLGFAAVAVVIAAIFARFVELPSHELARALGKRDKAKADCQSLRSV